jgi:uncharacterized phage protein (TIGR02216 family)
MELGLGHLGMTPGQLWCLTFPEWNAKLRGFMEFHGIKPQAAPMTRKEMDAMIEEFPDGVISLDERRRRKKLGNELDKVDGGRDSR